MQHIYYLLNDFPPSSSLLWKGMKVFLQLMNARIIVRPAFATQIELSQGRTRYVCRFWYWKSFSETTRTEFHYY